MSVYKTTSSKQTKKLAGFLAKKFLYSHGRIRIAEARAKRAQRRAIRMPKNALILALQGELGSGKTTFIQGFLRGLGIKKKITSPTFVLVKNYELRIKNYGKYKHAYHIDCYRIKKASELLKLGLKEILGNFQNIVLIEWAEKIQGALPKNTIWLKFEHGSKENIRVIRLCS